MLPRPNWSNVCNLWLAVMTTISMDTRGARQRLLLVIAGCGCEREQSGSLGVMVHKNLLAESPRGPYVAGIDGVFMETFLSLW